jgi:hypothetical protein
MSIPGPAIFAILGLLAWPAAQIVALLIYRRNLLELTAQVLSGASTRYRGGAAAGAGKAVVYGAAAVLVLFPHHFTDAWTKQADTPLVWIGLLLALYLWAATSDVLHSFRRNGEEERGHSRKFPGR